MAVYDHGKSKLQVFCFGCKYHGWVTPSDLSLGKSSETEVSCGNYPQQEPQGEHLPLNQVQDMVKYFFRDRNIDRPPWGHIVCGTDVFNNVIRPYMMYHLTDIHSNIIGQQYRFLDTLKPKVKTVAAGGRYPSYAWWRAELIEVEGSNIRVVESWVDAVFLEQYEAGKPTLILLGTNINKVDWYKLLGETVRGGIINLWFDGDKAGMECASALTHKLESIGGMVFNHTRKDVKVYQHGNV
jgi:hypothetical protein